MIRTILAVCALALLPQCALEAAPRLGFNLSGLEAGSGAGKLYYSHVPPAPADVDLAVASGATLVRIPFRMSRIIPKLGGPFDPAELAVLKTSLTRGLSKPGVNVILDDHGFGSSWGVTFGAAPLTPDMIAGQWQALLRALGVANNPRVLIGLQNEPHVVANWWTVAQATVTDLRTRRVTNPVSLDGNGYSSAAGWAGANGPAAAAFVDPAHATIFEPHVYFDSDDSGTHNTCIAGSASRVDPVLASAAAHGYQVIFGEMAFGADPSCDAVRTAAIAKLKASPNVYGVTFWTLGNFALYPAYMFGMTGPTKGAPSVLLTKLLAAWGK